MTLVNTYDDTTIGFLVEKEDPENVNEIVEECHYCHVEPQGQKVSCEVGRAGGGGTFRPPPLYFEVIFIFRALCVC